MYFFISLLDMVLDQEEALGELSEEVKKKIREALLKQHHHQNQKKLANRIPIVRSFADIGKKQSESNSMDKNGMLYPKRSPSMYRIHIVFLPHFLVDVFFCFGFFFSIEWLWTDCSLHNL